MAILAGSVNHSKTIQSVSVAVNTVVLMPCAACTARAWARALWESAFCMVAITLRYVFVGTAVATYAHSLT